MPPRKKDGSPPQVARRAAIRQLTVDRTRPEVTAFQIWDTHLRGFCLRVQPTGQRSYKVVYSRDGIPRWYHIADAAQVDLADARKIARKVLYRVADGEDPVADRQAQRGGKTFAEIYQRYLTEHAMRNNKSWGQGKRFVEKHVLPRLGKLPIKDVTRADVRAVVSRIKSRSVANQVRASASAVFSWSMEQDLIAANPCAGIKRHKMKARSRVLSDSEVPKFWAALDRIGTAQARALKVALLTGQRSGEVRRMRWEHVIDGWWKMPGAPVAALGWPGTKNGQDHNVWLPRAAWAIIGDHQTVGFVFNTKGNPVERLNKVMHSIGIDGVRPHDLRRTHGSAITGLGFGRDAMNRIQNHREGGVADVYDQSKYAEENKRVMETVSAFIMDLAESRQPDNVVAMVR